jgi:hypothetical protein
LTRSDFEALGARESGPPKSRKGSQLLRTPRLLKSSPAVSLAKLSPAAEFDALGAIERANKITKEGFKVVD